MTYIVVLALFLHFVADFLLQSREMGQKKSTELKWLYYHLLIQYAVMFAGLQLVIRPRTALLIALCNTAIHGLIDWNIWRGYKLLVHKRLMKEASLYGNPEEAYQHGLNRFKYWEDHLFYSTIGLDQFLHSITLIILLGVFI